MESSAIPIRMKMSTLAAEGQRRLRNCGKTITIEEKKQMLSKMMSKMKWSGYSERLWKDVLESACKGYYRQLDMEENDGIRVNKKAEDTRDEREVRKVVGRGSWHKRVPGSHSGKFMKPGKESNPSATKTKPSQKQSQDPCNSQLGGLGVQGGAPQGPTKDRRYNLYTLHTTKQISKDPTSNWWPILKTP